LSSLNTEHSVDLFVIAGAINGNAALRANAVAVVGLAVEAGRDERILASATSLLSPSCFTGGLRYLEYWEVRPCA